VSEFTKIEDKPSLSLNEILVDVTGRIKTPRLIPLFYVLPWILIIYFLIARNTTKSLTGGSIHANSAPPTNVSISLNPHFCSTRIEGPFFASTLASI
jgi:hypothetical protein